MDNWLQQVSAAAKDRVEETPADFQSRHRREFLRCSGMVRKYLTELATTFWPAASRRHLRVTLIPMPPVGPCDPITLIWNRFRVHHGWRVRNVRTKEAFEIFLGVNAKGFFFELPTEYRTTDTSKEQLQDALCKAAVEGPIADGDRDVIGLY